MHRKSYKMFCSRLILLVVGCTVCSVKGLDFNSSTRQANGNEAYLWPNGIVPYQISSLYSFESRAKILDGIAEFEKYTCLQFVPQTTETDYIFFTEHLISGTCWAGKWEEQQLEIGRLGGVQYVSLIVAKDCLQYVMHEIMHGIGFWHEQQREDRDQYVNVFYENLNADVHEVSYGIRSTATGLAKNLNTPYDYNSITHYHKEAFQIDKSKPTMAATDGCSLFGNQKQLSKIDALRINQLYNCPTPYKPPPPKVTYDNVDDNAKTESCQWWASVGECTKNPSFMNANCKKSCGITDNSVCPSCQDKSSYCPSWAATGYCTYSEAMAYMYMHCRKSCEVC
ncbi:hatching enzyme 1.2-like isoform X2 [Daphnia pulicaria]|uniref:hatching enzyme 1.2-like isoform X2 n=1 Tax=Daphnia pulicaria TaxID=35523 RepID=UPI001EEBBA82|nr:hatching enzyme 1.2-like isoform X2 [Daphnia pulicaria]